MFRPQRATVLLAIAAEPAEKPDARLLALDAHSPPPMVSQSVSGASDADDSATPCRWEYYEKQIVFTIRLSQLRLYDRANSAASIDRAGVRALLCTHKTAS